VTTIALRPAEIAIDQPENPYTTDGNTVRKISPIDKITSAGNVTVYAGKAGEAGSTDAPWAQHRFSKEE
jgi:hypothetical protein